jgi:WD40 repeat protein
LFSKSILGILRLWKFETRRCICVVRVPGTCNLHALDFGIRNLSDSSSTLIVVGYGEQPQQSRTVVCIYNTLNAHKGSIELICRTTTDASITHIRFVPYDSTRFISIGLDNIRFWRIKNGNDLKSMSISVDDINQLEYTDLQFEHISNNKLNELIVYISSKSGHIIELLYDERRVTKIHRLLPTKYSNDLKEKITMTNGPSIGICALTCTNNFCITGSNDGYVRVWSNDFSQVYIEAKHDQAICGLITSHDQTRILISTISGSLGLLNLINKEHFNLIRSHTQFVTDIDYDDTRKQMISVGQDGTIRIWCFNTGKQLSEFTAERETPIIVTYAPNRQIFACGFNNGTIKVFELNSSIISAEIT